MNVSTSREARSGSAIVKAMSRKDFDLKLLEGVARTRAFGALVTFMAKNLSKEDKQEVRRALNDIGIPFSLTKSDHELDDIAAATIARSVSSR